MLRKKQSFPIDIVYLWVDGEDRKVKSIKNKYLQQVNKSEYIDDVKDQIFRDNEELKYSLRSIEQNAPWINHIYIVTGFGQKPHWLNIKNPKVTIVPQENILPKDSGYIFNSCAIEACLDKIPGLSEHFLLANDDMFFNMPTLPEYFFDESGRAKFRYIYRKHGRVSRDSKSIYLLQLINSARAIENAFGVSLYNYKSSHGIDPYIKSSITECCNDSKLKDVIEKTQRHMFRDETDVHRVIFNYYDFIKNRTNFIISHSRHIGHNFALDFLYNLLHCKSIKDSVFFCTDAIKSHVLSCKAKIVCINDSVYNSDITRKHNKLFFDTKFPNKSQFEK